jgi:hypothetical protein
LENIGYLRGNVPSLDGVIQVVQEEHPASLSRAAYKVATLPPKPNYWREIGAFSLSVDLPALATERRIRLLLRFSRRIAE